MRYFHPNIELHMRKTAGRWKMLRFLQHQRDAERLPRALVAVSLLGIGMWRGWIENPYAATALLIALATGRGAGMVDHHRGLFQPPAAPPVAGRPS